jgi:hypothetical protein
MTRCSDPTLAKLEGLTHPHWVTRVQDTDTVIGIEYNNNHNKRS